MADDSQLWEQICRGDTRAFEAFYQENAPRLQMFLRRLVGDQHAAEDLLQEAFMQIWNRPNGFRPDRGSLRSYLYGIGRKRAAEWWQMHEVTSSRADHDEQTYRTDTAPAVIDAFEQLPERQRTLLWLREVEGQTYAELAEILEIPVGTVRSRLFAAREALRKIWKRPRELPKESS